MDDTGKKILNLMFRPFEKICVSPNKYGYHSVDLGSAMSDKVTLVSPNAERPIEYIHSDRLTLVALNPINGWRNDESCTAFRNILVEMDAGPARAQLEYIKSMKLPYSAAIWSGNKSIHFLISIDQDFPSEEVYRTFAMWILKALPMADQKTFNPSRSIRIPGSYREPGKKQRLIEYKGPVKLKDLAQWAMEHPEAMPVTKKVRPKSNFFDFDDLRPWVKIRLANGLDKRKSRNGQWYAIAFEFALSSYSYDDTIKILGGFFTPDRDFKEREWRTAIKSAFKTVNKKQP